MEKTDAEAEAPKLWSPDAKSQFIQKDSDSGEDQRPKEKGVAKDEMVSYHYQFNRHELEQTPGDGKGQGSLVVGYGSQIVGHDLVTELQQSAEINKP